MRVLDLLPEDLGVRGESSKISGSRVAWWSQSFEGAVAPRRDGKTPVGNTRLHYLESGTSTHYTNITVPSMNLISKSYNLS